MSAAPSPSGWVLLPADDVPERWQERAIPLVMVPLLDPETGAILDGRPASSSVEDDEARLVRLLANATPIRTIARQLGIGERATQKRLATLRERFGVATTAELSALLAASGFQGSVQQHEPRVQRKTANPPRSNPPGGRGE